MWARIKRVVRSAFGAAVEAAEDPEMIMKQNIRDLEDQVPKMNESIAMVKANVTLLEKDGRKFANKEKQLTSKIKAALKAGRRDIAVTYATQLEQVKADRLSNGQQLKAAQAAYEKAQQVKKVFMREKKRKVDEAKRALAGAKRAKWQAKVADSMEQFEVGGIDSTHDEMLRKLEETAALNESKLDMALDSVDTVGFEIEEEARKLEANETLAQFELELGLAPAEVAPPAATRKSIGGLEG